MLRGESLSRGRTDLAKRHVLCTIDAARRQHEHGPYKQTPATVLRGQRALSACCAPPRSGAEASRLLDDAARRARRGDLAHDGAERQCRRTRHNGGASSDPAIGSHAWLGARARGGGPTTPLRPALGGAVLQRRARGAWRAVHDGHPLRVPRRAARAHARACFPTAVASLRERRSPRRPDPTRQPTHAEVRRGRRPCDGFATARSISIISGYSYR